MSMLCNLRSVTGGASHPELYDELMAFCDWGERLFEGVSIRLSEHHGSPDGYLPSPLVLAGAVAGRTRRAHIMVAALILPLHDILRLAEDLAVLDLASGGRVDVVFAAGYREEEFDMFGADIRRRGRAMEEGIATLRRAWTGEPFEHRGRTVRVTPRPRRAEMPLVMGGSSDAAARRAARLGAVFTPSVDDCIPAYEAEHERLGTVGFAMGPGSQPTVVTLVHPDPDKAWAEVGGLLLEENNTYAAWLREGRGGGGPYREVADVEELRATGRHRIVSPAECVELVRPTMALDMEPLAGGLPPELVRQSRDLIEHEVLPVLGAE
jgi:alkanesulfonate monooxygenase SsuD/methylene tetrahydromethanopterin reductase-like flavin-dependent oxidoreductase (luciferase family)